MKYSMKKNVIIGMKKGHKMRETVSLRLTLSQSV